MKNAARAFLPAVVVFGLLCFGSTAEGQGRRPNIVVIVADDMGYADIGVHGSKDIPTPNIDALAAGGTRFTDAYVSGPVCSPTRAGLLTGRYQQRFGHEFNLSLNPIYSEVGLSLNEVTIADRLKAAGYRTALFGKWHLGFAPRFRPLRRGFDEFFGFLGGAHSYVSPTTEQNPLYDGDKVVTTTPYLTDALSDRAVDFINRQRSQPFFLYLAFNAVHVPLQATDKYLARFQSITDERRRTYAAMLSAMDDGIGRVMTTLREKKLEENTLIFFLDDNGGPTTQGLPNGSTNVPLRGSKGQTWEGGIRIPFIIRWKNHLPEGKIDSRPIIQLDVMPTALAAAGVQVQPAWKLDGVNLLPFLSGTTSTAPHESLYWRFGASMAIRKEDWKLVKTVEGPPTPGDMPAVKDLLGAEIYNLKDDIGEKQNLAAAHPERVKELADAWQRWNKDLAKPGWPTPQALR